MATTVRLLSTHDGNPPGTIVRLPDALAASFVAAGNASLDLTGGINKPATAIPHVVSSAARLIYNASGLFLGLGDAQGNLLLNASGATIPGGLTKPDAPTGFALTAAAGAVIGTFTPPGNLGGDPSVRYVMTLSNGTKVEGGSSPIAAAAPAGVAVTGSVTAISALGESVASNSSTATPTGAAASVAPAISTAAAVTGIPQVGTPITITSATFTGNPTPTVTRVISVAGVQVASGGQSTSYTPVTADIGKTITVADTASNGTLPNAVSTSVASAAIIAAAVNPTVPDAPTIGTATAGTGVINVNWTAPANNGGAAISGYEVTLLNGTIQTVGNVLTAAITAPSGTPVTATVKAINSVGKSTASAQSNSVTPAAAVSAPAAPVTTAIADAGANMMNVTTAAPASNGSAVTAMNLRAYDATTGIEDPYVYDTNAGSTSLTHKVLGVIPGKTYKFKWTATNGNGTSSQGADGVSKALPVLASSVAKKTEIKFGIIGLMALTAAKPSISTYALIGTLPYDWTHVRIHALNASTAAQTVKIAFSSVPVLGTYPATLGSAPGATGMPGLNNGGNWTEETVTLAPATGTAAENLDGPKITATGWMANPNTARTDGGTLNAWTARIEWPAGADVTYNDIMPGNVGSPQDYGLAKVDQLGGIVLRPWTQPVGAVTDKTAFTQTGAQARATGSAAFFVEFRLANGKTGIDAVMLEDSRGAGGVQATNAPINHYLRAWAEVCTKDNPVGFLNASEAGAGPQRWKNRAAQFISVCGGSRVFTQTQSINYYGSGPNINGYGTNKTLCDEHIAMWEAAGCQVIRMTTMGVDTSKQYKWVDDSIRHNGNVTEENQGSGTRPTIALGAMNDGPISTDGCNSYTQFSYDGATGWLEPADATGAHMNETWGIRRAPYIVPYLK